MAKKLKNLLLASALTASAMFAGCGSSNNNNESEDCDEPKTESAVSQKSEAQIREEQKQMYYEYVVDSIRTANGQKQIEKQLSSDRCNYEDRDDIKRLQHKYTLGGTMEQEVYTNGVKIINKSYQQIVDELAKYGVKLDNYISQDSEYFTLKKGYKWGDPILSKYGMCFVGVDAKVGEGAYDDAESAWDDFVSQINTAIDNALASNGESYGENQKNNMKTTVKEIVEKTKRDLNISRESVEQKYSDYYLLGQKQYTYLGASYWSEDGHGYGYDDLNDPWINGKYLITERSIDVYDSNLKVSFFGDKDATYKLVSLGNGKWQVIKTYKNGKTEKTHVFEDPKDFHEESYGSEETRKVGETKFSFSAGVNMGVRVYWEEVVSVQQRKKDWVVKIPGDVQHTIDSLNQKAKEKEELYELKLDKYHEADSIAKSMVNQRFGQKEL